MGRIHKLPFIFGCLAAMAAGVANYVSGAESRTIYMQMAVMMLTFYIIGVFVKNNILSIGKEVLIKKKEQEIAEEQRLRQQIEDNKASAAATKQQQMQKGKPTVNTGQQKTIQTHKLDLVAQDTEDDFKPLELSKAISTKVKE